MTTWFRPNADVLAGRTVSVVRYDTATHLAPLAAALTGPRRHALWRYLPPGMGADEETLKEHLATHMADRCDPWQPYVLIPKEHGRPSGLACFMRVRQTHGVAELGAIVFAPDFQRTTAATESLRLMLGHLLDQHRYRRVEWKCDSANAASQQAALRLGFTTEGVFRQDRLVNGRNRDTAWFSMLDHEWPRRRAAIDKWLEPENFEPDGRQRTRLQHSEPPSP